MKKIRKHLKNFIISLSIVFSMYFILKKFFGFEGLNTEHLVVMIVTVFFYVSIVPFPKKII